MSLNFIHRQWLIKNVMENLETAEAQEMQGKIRKKFKETLKRKVEALDRQLPKRVRVNNEKAKGKMLVIEEPRSVSRHEENEDAKREEAERKLEVYQSKATFQMKDLTGIKMSTMCEMVKHVRKEQVTIQQNISLNTIIAKAPSSSEILKFKKEIGEETKDTPPQQTPQRIEASSPQPQQTLSPSPIRESSTPSPQRQISTPSSSRKKRSQGKPESSLGLTLAEGMC
ncbi:hypothetical protein L1987_40458 [Smallanthus sonchifolius]|uniref:Uncharacterized protein n=1 Tax=Smallanthus sonchifolius TaxID=185202 RepID=A0ACB9GT61_9ASTR|nr:hypothetical protein L1987_40458 [Smallanthus sonchifolius]